jgi:hypothetical protein
MAWLYREPNNFSERSQKIIDFWMAISIGVSIHWKFGLNKLRRLFLVDYGVFIILESSRAKANSDPVH